MDKKRVFVDMDGTLAEWMPSKTLEELYQPGYFAGLNPQMSVVQAVKKLATDHADAIETYILSAVLEDCPYAIPDKNHWLDLYLPEVISARRLFVSGDIPKPQAVPGGVRPDDVLLDDYTVNLLAWSGYGKGVKLLNGINHSRGTWKGPMIHKDRPYEEIIHILLK